MQPPCPRERGFTLIEALVVLAVVAMIAGLVFPAVDRARTALELRNAHAQVLATVASARAQSVRGGSPVALGLDAQGRLTANGLADQAASQSVPAPSGTVRVTVDPAAIRFLPDGSVTGGRIDLVSAAGREAIAIARDTGRISVAEGNHAAGF